MVSIKREQLKKKAVFLGFEDVLVPGAINEKVDAKKVKEILKNLKALEEKGLLNLVLLVGYKKEKAIKLVKESGLYAFFKPENIFTVTEEYLASKEEIDRKRYEKSLAENPDFKDEFLKQVAIKEFLEKKGIEREEALLIGHDLLTDAFYTREFSKIDVALVKGALSERHEKAKRLVKGTPYIKREWTDVLKLLTGKGKKPEYPLLKAYIYTRLKEQLFGDDIAKKVALTREQLLKAKNN
ncbi:MAG: hypothetical protein V1494_01515 [Candidatus Diapherotrites archaeon]